MPGPWEKYGSPPEPASGPWQKYAPKAQTPTATEEEGVVRGFLKNSPIGAVQGAAEFIRHPIESVKTMGIQNAALFDKAAQSYKKGDYTSALFHALNYMLPGGAALDEAGEDFASGKTAKGTAKTLGIASTLIAGAKAPQMLQAAGKAVDVAPAAINAMKAGAKAAAPDVGVGAVKIGVGAALPKIPGVSYGLEYVGGKQIVRGLGEGVKAARESMAGGKPNTAPAPVVESAAVSPELDALAVKAGFPDFASAPAQIKPLLENANAAELERLTRTPAAEPVPQSPVEQVPPTAPEAVAAPPRTVSPEAVGTAAPKPPVSEVLATEGKTAPITDLEQQLQQSLEGKRIAPEERAALEAKTKAQAELKSEQIKAREQSRRALSLGQFLDQHAIPVDKMELMTPQEWTQVGKLAGVENPSPTTVKMAIEYRKASQPAVSEAMATEGPTTAGEVMQKVKRVRASKPKITKDAPAAEVVEELPPVVVDEKLALEHPASARHWTPKLEAAGLVDEHGARTLEMAMRREMLSDNEVLAVIRQATKNGQVRASGKEIADAYQQVRLPNRERMALSEARWKNYSENHPEGQFIREPDIETAIAEFKRSPETATVTGEPVRDVMARHAAEKQRILDEAAARKAKAAEPEKKTVGEIMKKTRGKKK